MGKEFRSKPIDEGFQSDQQRGYQPSSDINAGFQPNPSPNEGKNPPTFEDTIDSGDAKE